MFRLRRPEPQQKKATVAVSNLLLIYVYYDSGAFFFIDFRKKNALYVFNYEEDNER